MSQTLIVQQPLKNVFPVGQDVMYTVSNSQVVSTFIRVKFIAEVHISNGAPPNANTSTDLVGTFKTTPNNAGVGMFDFRPIIENFVKSDNIARKGSSYKTNGNGSDTNVPIHLIDKFSGNKDSIRWFTVKFMVEYEDATGTLVTNAEVIAGMAIIFNGYLKYSDELLTSSTLNQFGYDLDRQFKLDGTSKKFLTNAPVTQYANIDDYGTVGLLMNNVYSSSNLSGFEEIEFNFYDSSGGYLNSDTITNNVASGGFVFPQWSVQGFILFAGIYPANLQNWSTIFQGLVSAGTIQGGYYTVNVMGGLANLISQTYTINVNCPSQKGYEPIRLTWLNQWGLWDYYTFNMKSTKSLKTKGSTYQQLEGSWNDSFYKINSFKGGTKTFRVNTTEKIKMNTDFVNEAESEWFEELINSPEVYILEGHKDDVTSSALNRYVTPVRLTTSSYTKKTVANDKLMQYTFEVEKSKTLRTQSV